jgi:alkylation response protein AidB-like acyl-CoA dehydrogenase
MRVTLTDDQRALAASLRGALEKEWGPAKVREVQASDAPHPARLWQVLGDIGVFGLALDEGLGGFGGDLFELGLFYEEAGRVLCSTRVYSTLGFRLALQRLGRPQQQRHWLPRLVSGELTATLALWNPSDNSDLAPTLTACPHDEGWLLSGTVDFVPNADTADVMIVSAVTEGDGAPRTICCVLDPSRPECRMTRHRTFSRENQGRVILDELAVAAADTIALEGIDGDSTGPGTGRKTPGDLRWVSNAVTALQCMEMTGGALSVLDRTVGYVKDRHQFNRPIASFQAAQHHVANMHIALDAARLTAYQAVWLLGRGHTASREVAIAKLKCNEAYKFATLTAHQLHGGMGFLRETDLHLWSQRAKSTELLGGAWDVQLAALERALLSAPSA